MSTTTDKVISLKHTKFLKRESLFNYDKKYIDFVKKSIVGYDAEKSASATDVLRWLKNLNSKNPKLPKLRKVI